MACDELRRRAFLDVLPEMERVALLRSGRGGRAERGEVLIRAGDRVESAFVLLSGFVKIHDSGPQGDEVVLEILGPGELLGEIAAVRDALRSASVTALASVEHVVIPAGALRMFLAAHPSTMLDLLDLTLARLHSANARRIEFALSDSLARVASRLVELAERFGTPGAAGATDVRLPITQEELASWSASSRESTARALRTLRELRLIETGRRQLTVHDLGGLRAQATQV